MVVLRAGQFILHGVSGGTPRDRVPLLTTSRYTLMRPTKPSPIP